MASTDELDVRQRMKPFYRKFLTALLMTIMGTIFACGIVRFSDGPISKRTDGGYKGKQGQPHTKEDFELFNLWQNTLMVLWPSGIMALYFLSRDILDKKKLNKF